MSSDKHVQHIRRVMLRHELPSLGPSTPLAFYLYHLLRENPNNEMAIEYLMADLLLMRQTAAVAEAVLDGRTGWQRHGTLPAHHAEAVVFQGLLDGKPVHLTDMPISASVREEAIRLTFILRSYGDGPKAKAAAAVAKALPGTYYAYLLTRQSGRRND